MTDAPLVSVLMPTRNQAAFIGEALDSILIQDYPAIEVIVVDGASSDGTLSILKARSAADTRLRTWSEPDSGPAQALNRALQKARGSIIGWLNSDDLYVPGAIRRAVAALSADRDMLMIYGHGEHVDVAGKPIGRYPTLRPAGPLARFADGCFICQPTVFFRRALPVLLGPFDESFAASFDFDYWVRAFSSVPERIGFVDALLARSRLHADGITARRRRDVAIEGMRIVARLLGTAPVHWLSTYFEEVMALPPEERPENLRQHLEETLDLCAPSIEAASVARMRQILDTDPRLVAADRSL